MNKTATTELHRTFLIEQLPEPLTPASSHIQIFDNYIPDARIRLRAIRDPYSNKWSRMLQQRFYADEGEMAVSKLAEMHLNDAEFAVFEAIPTRQIRKNRYFHEFDLTPFKFDVYLGDPLGLVTARTDFESREKMLAFEPPPFVIFEITNDPFFAGERLVTMTAADIRAEVDRIGTATPPVPEMPDE